MGGSGLRLVTSLIGPPSDIPSMASKVGPKWASGNLITEALRYGTRCLWISQLYTCHPRVYPRTAWITPLPKLILILPTRRNGRLSQPSLHGWRLHTQTVYPSENGHPSKNWPGPMLINFVDHYTKPPSRSRQTNRQIYNAHKQIVSQHNAGGEIS